MPEKLTNKHSVDISRLSADDMDVEIEKGFYDMLAGRIVSAKKAFVNIRKNYGLADQPCQRKDEITIHSSVAEYLTYVAAVGDNADSMKCDTKMKIYG